MKSTKKNPSGVIDAITAGVVFLLETEDIEHTRAQALNLGKATRAVALPEQFVYFAAFDGTNNDKTRLKVSGTPQWTNVAQLYEQANAQQHTNPNQKKGYYAGVGTSKSVRASGDRANNPTPATVATAQTAYDEFCVAANQWLRDDPSRSATNVMAAITGFSRGAGTAIAFATLLNDYGLRPDDGIVGRKYAPPINVVATMLFDPVFTGLMLDLRLPRNINNNVVVVKARDEFRDQFKAADFSADLRVRSIEFYGNHGNIGGFYDNGIGALVLDGATTFFRNSGIAMAGIPLERQFVDRNVFIYNESIERKYNNKPLWTEVNDNGLRLTAGVDNRLRGERLS